MKNDNEYLEPKIDSGKKEEIIDGFPDDERTDTGKGEGYYTRDGEKMLPSMDDVRAYEGARSCKPNYLVTILPGGYYAEIQLATKIWPDDDKGKTL